ncbi:MAG TPA: hypothetical protein PKX36_05520 [Candidatus Cloacimonadota bacterium]|nr:hypothetical protein [Candidatus Cloacimonadota bacterium]
MKAIWRIALLAMLVLSLSLVACGKDDDDDDNNDLTGPGDITPANTDWEITFIHNPDAQKLETYYVMVDWLGDISALAETDTYSMKLDNVEYPLSSYWMFGMVFITGEVQLNPGYTYNFEFYRNGNKVCDTNVKMPYPATATFPANFSPTSSANITWSLSDNNQYQFAGVSCYGGAEQSDDAIEQIPASARSYTVPANAVTGFGAGTEYELLVSQLNFARDGRTAISAVQGQYKSYGTAKTDPVKNLLKQTRRFIRSSSL